MKDIIIQIGEDDNGVYLLHVLKTVPGHNIRGVICTDQKEQVERLKAVLPEGTELAAGTSRAILEPRTKNCQDTFPTDKRAWELFHQVLCEAEGVTIVAMGSLTNLAISLMRYPDLRNRISGIVYLGGSASSGDVTAFAEKGIHDDPLAAKVVFESGIDVKMLGLDVTGERSEEEKEKMLARLCEKEEEFELLHCHVGIETVSPKTMGMSVCDIYGKSPYAKNVYLVRAWKGETL